MKRNVSHRVLFAYLLVGCFLPMEPAYGKTAGSALCAAEASGQAQGSKKKKKKRKKPYLYTVKGGDSLGKLASTFGVRVKEIRRWNRLKSDTIYVGRELKIYPRKPIRVDRQLQHVVKKGQTLGQIAKKYNVPLKELMRKNRIRNARRVREGKVLKIVVRGPENLSEATGRPQSGKLIHGEQMPLEHPCYVLKRTRNAWGTNETIEQLMAAIDYVCHRKWRKKRRKKGRSPRLVVGDISKKKGGKLPPHKSHQNGRDVDLGYYHSGKKRLKEFKNATADNLDEELTWQLIRKFQNQDSIEYIFMDRKVQKWLYGWALKKKKLSKRKLQKVFQYPSGRGRTLIRHEPGHLNHMHVRFRCPSTDESCF